MTRRATRLTSLGAALAALLTACESEAPPAPAEESKQKAPEPDPEPAADPEEAAGQAQEQPQPEPPAALLDPDKATDKAPAEYTVKLETTEGDVLIDVKRKWAPRGADRFYNLVKLGYFDDNAFFRVVDGFMAQVGISPYPQVNQVWRRATIEDDEPRQGVSNKRGMVSFATSGADSRTTQFFINYGDNSRLDKMGFTPIGKVRDMKPVDALYAGYGEGAPRGRGPMQARIHSEGNRYLEAEFPKLDYIEKATVVE